jgi:hypothetical protein
VKWNGTNQLHNKEYFLYMQNQLVPLNRWNVGESLANQPSLTTMKEKKKQATSSLSSRTLPGSQHQGGWAAGPAGATTDNGDASKGHGSGAK